MGNKYGITSYMFRMQGQTPFVCIPLGIITVERITDNFFLKKHILYWILHVDKKTSSSFYCTFSATFATSLYVH